MAHSHPFLDGNGRTIMLVHQDLCSRAGFHIDWKMTSKSSYLHVLTQELAAPGKRLLDDYLKPFIVMKQLSITASLKQFLAVPGLNTEAATGHITRKTSAQEDGASSEGAACLAQTLALLTEHYSSSHFARSRLFRMHGGSCERPRDHRSCTAAGAG